MGIEYRIAKAILQEHKYRPITGTILLIGRQMVSMTPTKAIKLVKSEGLKIRKDAKIEMDNKTHGSPKGVYITDSSFFSLFSDAKVLALDVSAYEGAEIIADLNLPIDERYHNTADFIFNGSCLDNLFDASSALKNISRLLKPGGRVVHIEHGSPIGGAYVMYSPAMFFEYYAINKFSDCKIYTLFFKNRNKTWHIFNWEPFNKVKGQWVPTNYMNKRWRDILTLTIAEKGEDSTSDKTPIQGTYLEPHQSGFKNYLDAFLKYRSSSRPLLNFPKKSLSLLKSHPAGFSYLGNMQHKRDIIGYLLRSIGRPRKVNL